MALFSTHLQKLTSCYVYVITTNAGSNTHDLHLLKVLVHCSIYRKYSCCCNTTQGAKASKVTLVVAGLLALQICLCKLCFIAFI